MARAPKKRSQHRVLGHLAVSGLFLMAGLGTTRLLLYMQDNFGSIFDTKPKPLVVDDPDVDVQIADAGLTPEQVVGLQIESIHDSAGEPERLRVCYSLASPNNRSLTGPLEYFAEIVVAPPYDHLAQADDWQIGEATIREGYAAVLVSVIHKDQPYAYRFLLSQQPEPPYKGCWMTDGVETQNLTTLDDNADDSSLPKEGLVGE